MFPLFKRWRHFSGEAYLLSTFLPLIFYSNPQKYRSLGFLLWILKVLFCPGSLTLTGCHASGAFHRTHSGRVRRAAHCWVSGEPDSNRATSAGHAGSGLWKLCVQKWMIVQPSLLFKKDWGEESQCTHPWHPNLSLEESQTRGLFLLVFWQNKYMMNLKAI